MPNFFFHPHRITVSIIGMDESTHTRSWCVHHACGSLLAEGAIVHFRKLEILVDDEEQTVIVPTMFQMELIIAVLAPKKQAIEAK